MRYLVLGGAGFLGANLVRRCLQEAEAEVTVLDSLEYPTGSLPPNLAGCWDRITYIRGNICNTQLLKEIISGQDIIFNCAAQSSHTISLEQPFKDAETNLEGTLKILETMRFYNRDAVLMYPSTTSVIKKRDIYTIHKKASENYIKTYSRLYGIKAVGLRFSNLYGPFGRPESDYNFINHFIHLAFNNKTIEIFGTGDQIRNLTYIVDAVEIFFQAAFLPQLQGLVLFATSPFYLSVRKIAEEIINVFGSGQLRLVPWPQERAKIEIGSLRFSSKKMEDETGFIPSTDFSRGLELTLEFMKALEHRYQ